MHSEGITPTKREFLQDLETGPVLLITTPLWIGKVTLSGQTQSHSWISVRVAGQQFLSQQLRDAQTTCRGLWVLCTRNICMYRLVRNYKYWYFMTLGWCCWHLGKGSSLCAAFPYIIACSHPLNALAALFPSLLCAPPHIDERPMGLVGQPPTHTPSREPLPGILSL